ncbi:MAG: hypothetical protein QM642_03530 [Edaphocola sp.]
MSYFTAHLTAIVDQYKGEIPLSHFLKSYFKQYKKLGSRDRKALSEGVYLFYRCKKLMPGDTALTTAIATAIAWCNSSNIFLKKMLEKENTLSLHEISTEAPNIPQISEGITKENWVSSLLQQPDLFVKLRRNEKLAEGIFSKNGIAFTEQDIAANQKFKCLALPNGSKIEELLAPTDYVVQDASSQSSIYQTLQHLSEPPRSVWDVCGGAGGKSVFLKDALPPFDLLATDVRAGILHNFKERMNLYGHKQYTAATVNATDAHELQRTLGNKKFDLIVADVPCSGSGTWARTPEDFYFFQQNKLEKFRALQYPIAANTLPYLHEGGLLAYITCSVFKEENEDVVQQLADRHNLKIHHQSIINGIAIKADSMFVAILSKGGEL